MMKKRIKGIIAIMLTATICLVGCNKTPEVQKDVSAESVATEIEKTEKDAVQKELENAEEQVSVLEKRLQEDASLTQADMNDLSLEIYQIWDVVLNDLWADLMKTLDEDTMDHLLQEQRAWITEKETAAKEAGEVFGGGSMATMAANQKAAELTRLRVYELASYLGEL